MMHGHATSYQLPALALAGLLFAAFCGAAFYGWMLYGSSMLLALGENGLSWCF